MKNKNINYKIISFVGILILMLTLGSCEKYLDKAPEADISEQEVFGSFRSCQGFVEEMYNCVVALNQCRSWNEYLFADETLYSSPYAFDQGNYWPNARLLYAAMPALTDSRGMTIWPLAWYAIRKANITLSKLDLLVDATQEEKDLIRGQALFFRGWFHFELSRWWGGLPYVDQVILTEFNIPRLNYRETALKAAKDLKDAADLLPVNWDETTAGKATLGNNRQRINKVMALGHYGKVLLYAASPMMNEESTGNNSFDADLCKQAAAAFAEVLKICDETGLYKMQSWKTWTDNFWVWSPGNTKLSGGTEVIMNPPTVRSDRVRWSTVQYTVLYQLGGAATVEFPTHNFSKNYAMANGLPIDDPASGYNPNDPWTGREPRFYKDYILDGDTLTTNASAPASNKFARMYNGGPHRIGTGGTVTGYSYKRYSPIGCNKYDNLWNYFQSQVPYMRLADIYLMYAEAVLQGYGSSSSAAPGYSMTAEQALNVVRNRAKLPNLTAAYTATKDAFMEEIIRERAVELAFEGARFHDLRRWNLNGVKKYCEKTAIDYDRGSNGKPINLKERIVITRVVEKKHNWVPFPTAFTQLYPEFPQNPGW